MSADVYLGLGSNMGNREQNLKEAVEKISELPETRLIKHSSIYETEPVGYLEQGRFLNMTVHISTSLTPDELLGKLQQIELNLKRIREIHWGPRTIDIDMLLYGELVLSGQHLKIPHPRLYERAFVLVPLKDIFKGNLQGKTLEELIEQCADKDGLKLWGKIYD